MITAIRNLIVTIAVLLCASTAIAEDFDEKKELEYQSRTFMMENDSMPILKVIPGRGNAAVLNKMVEKFSTDNGAVGAIRTDALRADSIDSNDNSITEYGFDSSVVSNNGVVLAVSGDGTKAYYINEKGFENKKKRNRRGKIGKGKISKERLEVLGRSFIENDLSEFVKVGKNEELVPFNVLYEIDSERNLLTGKGSERVTGNIVIFSRKINGHHVIGAGSKISVMFANDETPVAFRYDWPSYQTVNMKQQIISKENLFERKSTLSLMRESATNVNLTRFECGYYDPGATRRDDKSVIQAGCAAFYEGKVGKAVSAVMDVIPIAEVEDVVYDPYWVAAQRIAEDSDMCESTDVDDVLIEDVDVQSK